ncbi:glutamine synthetase family protein [bacterium]|nr:glutamine synthetase family protein [bacterium]
MTNPNELRNHLSFTYEELEELNLEAKEKQARQADDGELQEHYIRYLTDEKRLKAVTICFSDIEGKLHMLDYDKKFLLKSHDNLTFDGSSVRGFTQVNASDLRLVPDWGSFRWVPTDVFSPGKVVLFGLIQDRDGTPYESDFRGRLKSYLSTLRSQQGLQTNVSVESEGFLFKGQNAERRFSSREGFDLVSKGGYYSSLSTDELRIFIDRFAEAQRALGFENEKDHPEVAPSQFELNYSYCDALLAADQVQLYKLMARQIAARMDCTASFIPKPVAGINGSGMHTNMSISKDSTNLFYDGNGEEGLSEMAWDFVDRLLHSANDICLTLNSSVNSYRRLDPNFEAPNQIKSSAVDRTSMVRIPLGNEKSARVEVRTVSPDANPYLAFYTLFKTGLEGPINKDEAQENRRSRTRFLPANIYDAIRHFKSSTYISELLGQENKDKFVEQKIASAHRCPRELGTMVKTEEILFHHEVTNQYIWSQF